LAKLHFYYSAMNAGKSTTLLQSHYNYCERGMDTLLFIPEVDSRDGVGVIATRVGLSSQAIVASNDFDFLHYTALAVQDNPDIKCVLIDEAQFLTQTQVKQLCSITDTLNIPVLAYGLRTDYRGEPFEGSQYLLAWADLLIELKTICHCGRKATMNLRIDSAGKPMRKGNPICIGAMNNILPLAENIFMQGKVHLLNQRAIKTNKK
jgi:thymidine kinase